MNKKLTYTLIMTEACNLRCKYCYINKNPKKISKEVLDAFILLILKQLQEGYFIKVDIFGGEPLLAWEEVQYFINQSNKILISYKDKLRFMLFSNAILFTEDKLIFLKSSKINVLYNFSIDGNQKCHDSSRIYPDGSGSWNDVLKGIQVFNKVYGKNKNNLPIGKFMISSSNIDFVFDVVKDLDKYNNHISFGLVRENWDDESVNKYFLMINKLAEYYIENIEKEICIDLFLTPILEKQNKKNRFCSAGLNIYGIAPNGDIYPCQRFYNNKSPYILGNVFTGIEEDNKWVILFKNFTAKNMLKCNKCKDIGYEHCIGQCIAALYEESNNNIFIPNKNICKILKKNYELADYIYETLKDNVHYQKCLNSKYYKK